MVGVLNRKWLFWFCKGSACVSGKTKCAICTLVIFCLFRVVFCTVIVLRLTTNCWRHETLEISEIHHYQSTKSLNARTKSRITTWLLMIYDRELAPFLITFLLSILHKRNKMSFRLILPIFF